MRVGAFVPAREAWEDRSCDEKAVRGATPFTSRGWCDDPKRNRPGRALRSWAANFGGDHGGAADVTEPLATVVVTTYEQEPYVAEALRSILAQEAPFLFEVVVGVDSSRDETAAVVEGVARDYPGVVRVLRHERRVGLLENFRRTHAEARGRFVALLEGDDYWTDRGKLAAQVERLVRRPEAAVCGHIVEQVGIDGRRLGLIPERSQEGPLSRSEWVRRHCDFHTSSLVYRNFFSEGLPASVRDERNRVVDLPLKLALVARGEVDFIPRVWSVFRRSPSSASASFDTEQFRDIVVQSLSGARRSMDPALRGAVVAALVEALVDGALSPHRAAGGRLRFAARALALRPLEGSRRMARGAYSTLPEGAKRAYRRARRVWRGAPGERLP